MINQATLLKPIPSEFLDLASVAYSEQTDEVSASANNLAAWLTYF